MIMITGIGGKNIRFPICHWTMYVYASKPLSSRLHARDEVCPRHCSKFPPIGNVYIYVVQPLAASK